jgi:hypothetical protein
MHGLALHHLTSQIRASFGELNPINISKYASGARKAAGHEIKPLNMFSRERRHSPLADTL